MGIYIYIFYSYVYIMCNGYIIDRSWIYTECTKKDNGHIMDIAWEIGFISSNKWDYNADMQYDLGI